MAQFDFYHLDTGSHPNLPNFFADKILIFLQFLQDFCFWSLDGAKGLSTLKLLIFPLSNFKKLYFAVWGQPTSSLSYFLMLLDLTDVCPLLTKQYIQVRSQIPYVLYNF